MLVRITITLKTGGGRQRYNERTNNQFNLGYSRVFHIHLLACIRKRARVLSELADTLRSNTIFN